MRSIETSSRPQARGPVVTPLRHRALERGAYLSLDSIGSQFWGGGYASYDDNITTIQRFVDAGYADRIIIGSDTSRSSFWWRRMPVATSRRVKSAVSRCA
jgi:predicted metal-dependent phosphotriesterase family hydrolase